MGRPAKNKVISDGLNNETPIIAENAPLKDETATKRKSAANTEKKAKTATKKKDAVSKPKARMQTDDEIFALDIGTRTVVGVLGHMDKETKVYHVDSSVTVPHTQRAMIDGQIEDIEEVARIVKLVKSELEKKNNIKLNKVAIAAAGRALKTRRAELEFDITDKDAMTEEMIKSFEVDTVLEAQKKLDEDVKNDSLIFYCVGHTVINYTLDDYQIKTLLGHRGKSVKIDLIAAFLPNIVVESLYSVMDLSGLEVTSMTLEPIAAMNVIIPPEVRLINVALVDIGAGTSDIAIAQNGSIVAYAMSTVAGDEITEEIIRTYLVDFQTAEEMKLCSKAESFSYVDILGFEHEIDTKDFYESLFPVMGKLADNICENMIAANGKAPAAVFLVGGGSLIPNLSKVVAEKLELPENRVAVGGNQKLKYIDHGNTNTSGPEFVTPIGIGVTATVNKGYDFSVVTVNDKKMRIFDTRTVTLIDLLVLAGYKTTQIIGRSGRSLTFTLNGEKQSMKGEMSSPAEILLNGNPAPIDTAVNQGDIVKFIPAKSGMNAECKLSDLAGDVSERFVTVDDVKYNFGIVATVNGKIMTGDYQIQNFDNVAVSEIDTLGDLMLVLPFDTDAVSFYVGGKLVGIDYYLKDNDDIFVGEKVKDGRSKAGSLAKAIADREEAAKRTEIPSVIDEPVQLDEELQKELREFMAENPDFIFPDAMKAAADNAVSNNSSYYTNTETVTDKVIEEKIADVNNISNDIEDEVEIAEMSDVSDDIVNTPVSEATASNNNGEFYVTLNNKYTVLEKRSAENIHEFIELIGIADIDIDNPPPSGNMILLLNGEEASFMSPLKCGDTAVIKWADN